MERWVVVVVAWVVVSTRTQRQLSQPSSTYHSTADPALQRHERSGQGLAVVGLAVVVPAAVLAVLVSLAVVALAVIVVVA